MQLAVPVASTRSEVFARDVSRFQMLTMALFNSHFKAMKVLLLDIGIG